MNIHFLIIILLLFTNSIISQSTSVVPVSINLSIESLEKRLNNTFLHTIYNDTIFEKDEMIKMKISKLSAFSLFSQKEKLYIKVPLKINATKAIGYTNLYKSINVDFDIEILLSTSLKLNENWKVELNTELISYKYLSSPEIEILKIPIKINPIIDNIIRKNISSICKKIDSSSLENLNFRPIAQNMWDSLSMPSLANPKYNLWMIQSPLRVFSTQLKINSKNIQLKLMLELLNKFKMTTSNLPTEKKIVPNLLIASSLPDTFILNSNIDLPIDIFNQHCKATFKNYVLNIDENRKVIFKDINFNILDSNLLIFLDIEGNVKGKIFISTSLFIDDNNIKLKDVKCTAKSKNLFWASAMWLFDGKIENAIKENFIYPLEPQILEIKNSANSVLNKKIDKNTFIKGDIFNISFKDIIIKENSIWLNVKTLGTIKMSIN